MYFDSNLLKIHLSLITHFHKTAGSTHSKQFLKICSIQQVKCGNKLSKVTQLLSFFPFFFFYVHPINVIATFEELTIY